MTRLRLQNVFIPWALVPKLELLTSELHIETRCNIAQDRLEQEG